MHSHAIWRLCLVAVLAWIMLDGLSVAAEPQRKPARKITLQQLKPSWGPAISG